MSFLKNKSERIIINDLRDFEIILGEYVLMVTDVTTPPFMGKTLEPAYLLMKMKKPKREKKAKEVKPK